MQFIILNNSKCFIKKKTTTTNIYLYERRKKIYFIDMFKKYLKYKMT